MKRLPRCRVAGIDKVRTLIPVPLGPTTWNPRNLSETQTVKHTGGRTVARYVGRGRPRPRGYEAQARKTRGPLSNCDEHLERQARR